ncbi:V-type proton ATPase subunit d 1-like isoform X1 [Osmerus mordax]|uniref:V-type proton ATPase subunit d 1-like isoform X1 n=1 Tax=Osmerus mordax TaxID=8014 RepID=UPI003510C9AA
MSVCPELGFNVDHGYLEGLVRGLKAGILTCSDYHNLTQCDTLEDMKLHLQSTDYGRLLSSSGDHLTMSLMDQKLKENLLVEFRSLRSHSVPPLSIFLDYITYSYMIDNVVLLITGVLRKRDISELLPRCHPLGVFDQMAAVGITRTPSELYWTILVDTPLAPFFQDAVSESNLDEMGAEILRNKLYKAYIESFHSFCSKLGGATEDIMCPILEFEADRRAFIITVNSFGTELSGGERSALYPSCGTLHPEGLRMLSRAEDYEQVKAVADYYHEYKLIFDDAEAESEAKTLEDRFFEREAEHAGLPAAVPPGRVLLLRPAEGAGGSQRHLDRRVCHAEAEVQDRQLHTYLLEATCFWCLRGTPAVASNKYKFLFQWSGH